MKDYYKILGIKETATEEEIRERWIERVRRLHPDQAVENGADDQKIKEINEAYEVLKFSSSRVKYDLRRAYDKRKERTYLRRLILRRSYFLLIPILLGLIYFSIQEFRVPSPPAQEETPGKDAVPVINSKSVGKRASPDEENVRFKGKPLPIHEQPPLFVGMGAVHSRETESSKAIQGKFSRPEKGSRETSAGHPKEIKKDGQQDIMKLEAVSSRVEPMTGLGPDSPKTIKTVPKESVRVPAQQQPREQVNAADPGGLQPDQTKVSVQRPSDSSTQRFANHRIAEEEEIKRFFENYIKHYTLMDINGFLASFSSKAVQNKTEDLNEIRKIYSRYFDQSQSLIFQLKDPRIEIFPDRVRVKAYYDVNQALKTGGARTWKGHIEWALVREDGELKISSLEYQHDRSP